MEPGRFRRFLGMLTSSPPTRPATFYCLAENQQSCLHLLGRLLSAPRGKVSLPPGVADRVGLVPWKPFPALRTWEASHILPFPSVLTSIGDLVSIGPPILLILREKKLRRPNNAAFARPSRPPPAPFPALFWPPRFRLAGLALAKHLFLQTGPSWQLFLIANGSDSGDRFRLYTASCSIT
jgi:hypothetical protein